MSYYDKLRELNKPLLPAIKKIIKTAGEESLSTVETAMRAYLLKDARLVPRFDAFLVAVHSADDEKAGWDNVATDGVTEAMVRVLISIKARVDHNDLLSVMQRFVCMLARIRHDDELVNALDFQCLIAHDRRDQRSVEEGRVHLYAAAIMGGSASVMDSIHAYDPDMYTPPDASQFE